MCIEEFQFTVLIDLALSLHTYMFIGKKRNLFVDVEIEPFEDKRGYICIEKKVNGRNQINNTHAGQSHIRSITVACIV